MSISHVPENLPNSVKTLMRAIEDEERWDYIPREIVQSTMPDILDAFRQLDEIKRMEQDKENDELRAYLSEARQAMQEFVDKVERGEAKSRRTYARFKALLSSTPSFTQPKGRI